jgi:energy-coupling factor transporter ATP-binding protein EcfA2
MLHQVGLDGHEDANPKHLSGGQRQRVAVARALVRNPELLLADEPTASLDGQTGREVMELLRRLARQQGCAVVIVTHDSRILDMADRLMYLEDGRLSSFAPATSAHAAHLLTALRPLAAARGIRDLLLKMDDPEFLDLSRTLAAESEQFLNVLEMGSTIEARDVVEQALHALLERACARLRARAALLWIDSADRVRCLAGVPDRGAEAPSLLKEVMRGSVPVITERALYLPVRDREHEISAVAEIRGEGLGEEAERTFRDYVRPLGIMAQLYERLEK